MQTAERGVLFVCLNVVYSVVTTAPLVRQMMLLWLLLMMKKKKMMMMMMMVSMLSFNPLRHKRQERANDNGGFSGGEPAEV